MASASVASPASAPHQPTVRLVLLGAPSENELSAFFADVEMAQKKRLRDDWGWGVTPEQCVWSWEHEAQTAMRAEACEEDERAAMTRRSEVAGPREVVEAGVLGSLVAQEPRKDVSSCTRNDNLSESAATFGVDDQSNMSVDSAGPGMSSKRRRSSYAIVMQNTATSPLPVAGGVKAFFTCTR